MGHQHHLSRRKSPEQALAYLKQQMNRHKAICVETPVERLTEVLQKLETIGLTVTTQQDTIGKTRLYFRWNGKTYEQYQPKNPHRNISIQWAWVKIKEENQ